MKGFGSFRALIISCLVFHGAGGEVKCSQLLKRTIIVPNICPIDKSSPSKIACNKAENISPSTKEKPFNTEPECLWTKAVSIPPPAFNAIGMKVSQDQYSKKPSSAFTSTSPDEDTGFSNPFILSLIMDTTKHIAVKNEISTE